MPSQTSSKPLPKAIAMMAITLIVAGFVGGVLFDVENIEGETWGSSVSPLTSLNVNIYEASDQTYYVAVGSSVTITPYHVDEVIPYSLTSGFGLTLDNNTSVVSGTISKAGAIKIECCDGDNGETLQDVTIIAVEAAAEVTSIKVSASATSVSVGGTITLTAVTLPEDAGDRSVTWTITSGGSYATIESTTNDTSGGTCDLKGVAKGIVLVKATANDGSGKTASITISVKSSDYTLEFDTNGGSGGPGTLAETSTTGSCTFTIPSTAPTKDGCNFLGWSTSSSATSAKYSSGDTYTTTSSSSTLYAVWQELSKDYALTFNANGGSGAPSSMNGSSDTGYYPFTIPAAIPSKSGYTFLGWSPSSTATAASYTSGDIYKATSTSAILYAVWKATEYTCTLNYSATGATNVPSTQTYTGTATTDHTFTIATNKPAKDGCSFLGWSTTNGSPTAQYQPGETISVTYNGTKTLYAVWVQNQNQLSITSSPSTTAKVGTQYVYDVTASTSGCTVTVSGASWLSVSGMKISGTPTVAGTYDVTVTVSKTGCTDAVQTFTIEVESVTEFTAPPSASGIYAYVR